ncbi:MAG: ribosomal RNA small subunit methyltransferase A [Candidatus Synoicihabitans palmerolidicus]|nr:ribosomal RNA small subunit methyltransferase A [Candidatus Synoicihabitans palmerolidicus]
MPLTPSQTRHILQSLAHHPRKNLSQNFLIDANIVQKSVHLADITPRDTVLEVGPGLGTLTSALLTAGAEVWAVEFDPRLAAHLQATLQQVHPDNLHLLQADALDHPRAGLPVAKASAGFKVVANLPYAISTPWLDQILSGPLPARMVLMLQWEATQHYMASPGSKQFGAISIFLQSLYRIAPGHKVPAACFHPRPDVESYLLNLIRQPEPFRFDRATHDLIRTCFQQRRKQIGALLRGKLPDNGQEWISSLSAEGLDARARPEVIPVLAWQRLRAA